MQKKDLKGERHAAIVIKDGQVLLIHRIKKGLEYYVFPGGHRRIKEDGTDTAVRETKEETEITIKAGRLAFKFEDYFLDKTDFYYLCSWEKGENPHLGGDEEKNNRPENFYEPMWINLEKIKDLNILPQFAKFWLLENLTILCSKNCS